MHILICGGTGFIGSHLCAHFSSLGHQVAVLTRYPNQSYALKPRVKLVEALNKNQAYDVVINLAGASLNKHRWNKQTKQLIYNSRIHTTQKILNYIQTARSKPVLFISGSAIGFYGNSQQQIFTENSLPGNTGFTHRLCADWEKTALAACAANVRVCLLRTGIVLGQGGGILAAMLPVFKWGIGAKLGTGEQWMSWIHINDVTNIISYLIAESDLHGAFNLTAPNPVTHATFTYVLAKILHRPCLIRLPSFVVKGLLGEMGETLLLQGQKVVPDKLLQAGYEFIFPHLDKALVDILSPF